MSLFEIHWMVSNFLDPVQFFVTKKKSLPNNFAQWSIFLFFLIYEPGLQHKNQHDKCG